MLAKIIQKLRFKYTTLKLIWQFKFSIFKLKCTHMRAIRYDIKILKFCVYNINKIGIPTNETNNESVKQLLSLYDKTIEKINGDIEKIRSYTWD